MQHESRTLKLQTDSASTARLVQSDSLLGLIIPATLFALGLLCATVNWASAADLLQVQSFRTHSRFAVTIDESTPVEWKKDETGFELLIKGATLADLGAPLGEESDWARPFRELKDSRIAGLDISESSSGVKIKGRWRYPSGAAALAEPRMDSFDYRSQTPAQFIVDVWHHAGPTLAEVQSQRKIAAKAAKTRHAESEKAKRAERKIAAVQARKEAENVGKFCTQPMSEKTDVILQLRPLHEPIAYAKWVATTTPDTGFEYYEPSSKEPEAQYVRLALELYRQGKAALVIRTLDFFESEHPKSTYLPEMRFLRANAWIKLGMAKDADDTLTRLITTNKDAPVALHAALYQAVMRADKGQTLAALDSFQWLIRNYPDHRLSWLFHMAAAEAYYSFRDTERASKEYQWVIEHAADRINRADASTRLGDLYLDRLQYEQALAAYSQATTYFPKEADTFPAYHLNRGETLYHLGQYDRAREMYQHFLDKYAAYPGGWRATYRLGEMAARAGNHELASQYYYDTVNHYPFSPGTTLARLRLIPCGDHGGMNLATGQKFLEGDAEKFEGRADVIMDRYADYRGLAAVRALWSWTTGSKAKGPAGVAARAQDYLPIEEAIRVLVSGKSPEAREILTPLITTLFRQRVERLLNENRKAEAVAFFQQKATFLPGGLGGKQPGDAEYLLKLSQAASDIGLGQVGEKIAAAYKTAASNRAPAEGKDSQADAEKTLRLSEQRFTQAKALWIAQGAAKEDQIRELLAQVGEESPFSYEKELILGLLADRDQASAEALKHAIRAQLLRPGNSTDVSETGRLAAWVAALQVKAGDPLAALPIYRGVENQLRATISEAASKSPRKPAAETPAKPEAITRGKAGTLETLGLPAVPELSSLILTQAAILEKQGRWGEASSTYGRAVEEGLGGNQAAYGQARALMRTGNAQERARGLTELEKLAAATAENSSDPWVRLAREALATEKSKTNRKSAKEGTTP